MNEVNTPRRSLPTLTRLLGSQEFNMRKLSISLTMVGLTLGMAATAGAQTAQDEGLADELARQKAQAVQKLLDVIAGSRRGLDACRGFNGSRNDRPHARGDSPIDRAAKNLNDKRNALKDYENRMKADHDTRHQPYTPGWIQYPDGRERDPRWQDLQDQIQRAQNRLNAAGEEAKLPRP
jgi:hypothetical protein